ncbi:TPA: MTAP family purine nucleoside phosphorylase [Candidatus Woesearchaeota archaeon]|nr:5'-methylthioadenosine phosphorylase II [archaeon GW2011_AR15]MBS3104010.1 5'-methylthioadenosine phosphorylase [Candidatus Woesearchaeota archaeon]HIH40923.1 MTAP family purine nucleoside phosphorylase [Candidatus Woesearchaeota archaeon]
MAESKTVAFIGGSGLAQGLEGLLAEVTQHEHVANEFGTVLSYYTGKHGNTNVVILPRHGESEGGKPTRTPAELVRQRGYEANIWQLYKLGVQAVYGTTAVGALDMQIPLADKGCFVVPYSYVRGVAASQHSFGASALNVHPSMGEPFDPKLIVRVFSAIKAAGYDMMKGVYIYNGGDAFETPEEIKVLEKETRCLNAMRVVGMTTVPEVMLLKQMNIPFAAIASNVNYAEGLSKDMIVSHEQTLKVMKKAGGYLTNIAKEIIVSY